MIRCNWRDGDGYIKRAPKQGDKPKYTKKGYRWTDEQKDIEICLTCDKPQCRYGICKRYEKREEE